MQFLNLTRDTEIGANSYLLELDGKRIVLDAGLHPKQEGLAATPDFSLLGGNPPDAIVLTHAHQDHVGALPVLTRHFPQSPVFLTEPTDRLADVMLHNSVNVMMRQQNETLRQDAVLFTHRGVELSRMNWQRRPLRKPFDIDGEFLSPGGSPEVSMEFFHAGHILGSAGVLIRSKDQSLFYTGDVHLDDQTLMPAADFPESGVDVLVMETTRGDSPSTPGYTRASEKQRLAELILAAFEEDASVTIPVFALGKTQELLAMLWELKLEGTLPNCPVYIGGLSTKVTEIYDAFAETAHRLHPELSLLHEMAPYVVSGREIDSLRPRKRCIFALSSGMMTENTLSSVFVRRILEDPKQRLLFVGYSDPESPAGRLRAAAPGETIILDESLPPLKKQCHVEELNFSAHASRESLLEFAVRLRPAKILLVHGDPPALGWFRKELAARLPDSEITVPQPGLPVTL